MKIVVSTDRDQPNDRYKGALLCAGAMPEEVVLVMPGDPLPEAFDGLLVAGGADVDPSRYGEAPSTDTLDLDPSRDTLDFALFSRAEAGDTPVFGICRGLQMLNVALGGTLWQDLPGERERGTRHAYDRSAGWDPAHPAHSVRPRVTLSSPLARLFSGAAEEIVNSRHHQAIKDLAQPLVPLAASPDDLVEAFERKDGPFFLGVQWHPEDLVARPFQKALFRSFLDACRERALRRETATDPTIQVRVEGSIAVVTLNRPARRNAFAGRMRELLAETIEALAGDASVPAIVLTGAGNAFSAGGDVEVMGALAAVKDEAGFAALLSAGAAAVLAIARAEKPVIAAIDGPAAGAGMNLALACDVRVASADPEHEASFAQPFARIGLAPDWGGTATLPMLAGYGAAADLVFSGDRIDARRAKDLGLVDLLADDGSSLPLALARANSYAERPAAALAAAKRNLNADRLPRLEQALEREAAAQLELFRGGALGALLA
ncbi:MAG TPA: gamma-glutamyl-gamma-aminobutyrate hydrolase family protein, partial [Thermoanaerobaculia bacterium]|nr:gamma-glutamyl-gamma-aminobutyrate hydrolase family protein [Thermoanaerobaculia bacterium]